MCRLRVPIFTYAREVLQSWCRNVVGNCSFSHRAIKLLSSVQTGRGQRSIRISNISLDGMYGLVCVSKCVCLKLYKESKIMRSRGAEEKVQFGHSLQQNAVKKV